MKSYIRKQNYDVSLQTEEVMGRLIGKARDVVKIGLRSDPSLSTSRTPEKHIDYWVHLNKAADMAEEGLKHQGRNIENMGGEISKMFVKHCPDQELASVSKYKQM